MNPQLMDAVQVFVAGLIALLGKWVFDAARRKAKAPRVGRKSCDYGEANRETISSHTADIRVLASQLREAQKQLDEIFPRIKDIEEKVNLILGHVKEHL